MHPGAYAFFRGALNRYWKPGDQVLEVGSRNINGSVRQLWDGVGTWTGIDLLPGDGVDIVADASTCQPAELVDLVICAEVLEHVPNPGVLVRNAFSWLKPGGYLLASMACDPRPPHSSLDGERLQPGEHYRNIAPDEPPQWFVTGSLEAPVYLEHYADRGDLYLVAQRTRGTFTADRKGWGGNP